MEGAAAAAVAEALRPVATDAAKPPHLKAEHRRGAAAGGDAGSHGHGHDGRHGWLCGGFGGAADAAAPGRLSRHVKYEPTAWGRYAKVLFSSSEFLFIN